MRSHHPRATVQAILRRCGSCALLSLLSDWQFEFTVAGNSDFGRQKFHKKIENAQGLRKIALRVQ
jgi:hypothetical protein